MSDDDYKTVDKTEQHTQTRKNPSLVSAVFIKYFFIAAITIIILYFLASYILPMFGQGGGTQSETNTDSGSVNVEIDSSGDGE
ncbi:MAG: hypothetical protein SCJ97_08665 [Bacillota bacterium]|nr:hypothetical protein [Bacillota bacterium]